MKHNVVAGVELDFGNVSFEGRRLFMVNERGV